MSQHDFNKQIIECLERILERLRAIYPHNDKLLYDMVNKLKLFNPEEIQND